MLANTPPLPKEDKIQRIQEAVVVEHRTTATWANAIKYCSGLTLAGKTWRLPHVNELKTIVDTTIATSPSIDTTVFPSTVASLYWTSTTYAWYVYFNGGDVNGNVKANTYYVRCVS